MTRDGLTVLRVFCDRDGNHGNPLGVYIDGHAVPPDERQAIAHELGYSETVFVDDADTGEIKIFTPMSELPFAGHPCVGTAWLLREAGHDPPALQPPAGEIGVRFDGELTWVSAQPEWGPPWIHREYGSAAEVEALEPQPDESCCWAWIDEANGLVRSRCFAPDDGIVEDEATGSAALQLTAAVGREIDIHQGVGSRLRARPLDAGRAEVAGRVVVGE